MGKEGEFEGEPWGWFPLKDCPGMLLYQKRLNVSFAVTQYNIHKQRQEMFGNMEKIKQFRNANRG